MISFRGAETHTRSVVKAISWRMLGTLDTFAISWLFTGRVEIAGLGVVRGTGPLTASKALVSRWA